MKHSGVQIPKGYRSKMDKSGKLIIEKIAGYGQTFRQKLAKKAAAKKPKYGKPRG